MAAPDLQTNVATEDEVVYCTVHPNVEATLRCNRCGRPMCTRCAVLTPVGYRCKQCVRQQQDTFFNAQFYDYLIAAGASVVISFVAAFFLSRIGFFYIAFLAAPAAGAAIGGVVRTLTGKRRGRYTAMIVGAGVALGALPLLMFNPLTIIIYLFLATGTAAAQFGLRL
ncbi:MAG TPA: B-box zinc finger protein [Aggregatilinea sp.]|uniref:B-box zinc finger protein n=1 Tax=Aggregatilinea sp. TaxID=2806333 RepID=UPI002CB21C13|nr:B-box zinc finger protein [Aggregatilinea sp.]HML22713.1 B-box zinc finger protein [Aggregatilinea sp.]